MSHLFVCFVALVVQGGAMAKFWPLHHYNQCMGENRRKTLSTARGRRGVSTCYFHQIQVGNSAQLVGEGACQPVISTKYRLGCELSYGICIHSYV